jgi:hypothetical protein
MTFRPLVAALALLVAVPAGAQSLGELAKKTAAEREKAKAASTPAEASKDAPKKFTDEDLKHLAPMPGGVDTKAATEAAAAAPAPPAATSPALADTQGKAADVKKDEAYWQGRMRVLTTHLDADTIASAAADRRAAQLQAEMDATERARDGVVYVDRVAKEQFLYARSEASRLKAVVDADRAEIAALEEEARIANVPPGWLRR